MGLSHSTHKEWALALEQFELGRRVTPDDPDLLENEWEIFESEGRYDTAMTVLQRARRVDPRSGLVAFNLALALLRRRQCHAAEQALAPGFAVAPNSPDLVSMLALTRVCAGDLPGARDVLRSAMAHGGSAPTLAIMSKYSAQYVLDDQGQRAFFGLTPADFDGQRPPWAVALAQVYRLRGDSMRERAYADSARVAANEVLRKQPADPETLMSLAFADAMLGRRTEAVENAERARALRPISSDALYGPDYLVDQARVEVIAGQTDAALAHVDTALSIPTQLSAGILRADPEWAPLRSDPRFQRLIAEK